MKSLSRLYTFVFSAATVLILTAMTVITGVDVVFRYVFRAPLGGTYEVTEVLMGLLTFSALPLVVARREHIVVDLFDHFTPERGRRIQDVIVQFACGVFSLIVAVLLVFVGRKIQQDALVTNMLQLPLSPVAYFGGAAVLVGGLVHLGLVVQGVRALMRHDGGTQ
jgi:TRAP-type C4-dicarboxylate transport system permease small subunit